MDANPTLGIILHAIGGLAAASFYIPYKKVKNWEWESYWIVGGAFSWIVAPITGALILCPGVIEVLAHASLSTLLWTYLFGLLWGVGGLTFGLSVRYLGLSLGYAIALGFCAAFGTIIPPIYNKSFIDLATAISGQVTLLGVAVCLGGIAFCGWAGVLKERELDDDAKRETIQEFNLVKGIWVAVFAGVMSACMAFAFAAGGPIGEAALEAGTPPVFQNLPILVVALLGGFTTNFVWCMYLNKKNGTFKNYRSAGDASLPLNYIFAGLAGIVWYLQFFFYSMGTTKMGEYDFSSWTIHMAFIIAFSNLWGLMFHEWKEASKRTVNIVILGIAVLVCSTIVVGVGNYLAK